MALNKIAKVLTSLIITSIVLLIAAYYYIFSFYMPRYFSNQVIPRLTKEAGIRGFSGKVKRVGVFGADLGQLVIGDAKNPALKVESVIIRYKPQSLLGLTRLRINRINLRGVELKRRIRQNKIEINHVNLEKFIQLLRKNFGQVSKDRTSAFSQARLSISNSKLYLNLLDKNHVIPFSLKFKPLKEDWSSFEADMKFRRKRHDIDSHMIFNLRDAAVEVGYELELKINKLKEFFSYFSQWKLPEGLNVSGNSKLNGSLCVGLKKIKLLHFKCHGVSKDAEFSYGRLQLQNRLRSSGIRQPLKFMLERVAGGLFYLQFKNVLCRKPFNLFLEHVRLDFPSIVSMSVTAFGKVEFNLKDLRHLPVYDTRVLGKNTISRRFKGRFEQQSGSWYFRTFDVSNRKAAMDRLIFDIRGFKTFCELHDLSIIGRGVRNIGSLILGGKLDNLTACRSGETISGSGLKFSSNLRIGPDKSGGIRPLANKFNFTLPVLFISTAYKSLQVNGLELSGSNKYKGATANRISAKLKLKKIIIKKSRWSYKYWRY